MILVFTERSKKDLNLIYEFLNEVYPGGIDFASQRLEWGFGALRRYPLLGTPLRSGKTKKFRELVISYGKSSFVIRYRIVAKQIIIAHIWHSRQNRFS